MEIEVIIKCSGLVETEDVMRALGALRGAPKNITITTTPVKKKRTKAKPMLRYTI